MKRAIQARPLLNVLVILALLYYAWIAFELVTHPFPTVPDSADATTFRFDLFWFLTGTPDSLTLLIK